MNDREKLEDMKVMLQSNGRISPIVLKALRDFKEKYPHVKKYVIITYLNEALEELSRNAKNEFLDRSKE